MLNRDEILNAITHLDDEELTLLFKEVARELDRRYMDMDNLIDEVHEDIDAEYEEAMDELDGMCLEDQFGILVALNDKY